MTCKPWTNDTALTSPDVPRPAGTLQPVDESVARTQRTLDRFLRGDDRVSAEGVERRIRSLPDGTSIARAWKSLLQGRWAFYRTDLALSHSRLLESSTVALAQAFLSPEGSTDTTAIRLACLGLNLAGVVYRRREQADEAVQTHLMVYGLRNRYGSWEELWETAVELGLDGDVGGDRDEAEKWYRTALEAARNAGEQPLHKEALAWMHLATSLEHAQQYERAVSAARTARECFLKHDPGCIDTVRATARLGAILLGQGERLMEMREPGAAEVLGESTRHLASAGEELLAFGAAVADEARICEQQREFAERLCQSCIL